MQQRLIKVVIPEDLNFSDLHLARDPDGSVSFDWAVVERLCETSGLSVEPFRDGPEDNVACLLVGWYQEHTRHGGESDPVAEDLIAEVLTEARAGQAFSLQPGHA